MWKLYSDNPDKITGLNRDTAIKLHQVLAAQPSGKGYICMFNCTNYLELLNALTSNLHSRVSLSTSKLSTEDQFIMKTFNEDYSHRKDIWSRLIELSNEMC